MDEKIVRLKLPEWVRAAITQISGLPAAASFADKNYAVYREREKAARAAKSILEKALGHKAKFRVEIELSPHELQWAHEHYRAESDRIHIAWSQARLIWMHAPVSLPQFALNVSVKPTFIMHEGQAYAVPEFSREYNVFNYTVGEIDPGSASFQNAVQYRLLQKGVIAQFDYWGDVEGIASGVGWRIDGLLKSGALQERVENLNA